jgi:hypothetical protein
LENVNSFRYRIRFLNLICRKKLEKKNIIIL